MRQILNFFITGFVLWASAWLFPEHVQFSSIGTLILVTLLYYIIETVVAFICVGIVLMRISINNSFTNRGLIAMIVVLLFVVTITGFGSFLLIAWLIDGFWISGFGTAFLLAVATSIFTVNPPKNQN